MPRLDMNTILTLNKDPKSIDLHSMALARMKNTQLNPDSKHDMIADRLRKKDSKNMDEIFQKIQGLHRSGSLKLWLDKYGSAYYPGMIGKKSLKESSVLKWSNVLEESSVSSKIDHLLEMSSGAPIAPFGGGTTIEQSSAKPMLQGQECSHQDPGGKKCSKKLIP